MRLSASERKKRLVTGNLAYVRAIAAKVKEQLPREIEFDDLVSYGTQGLLEAAERFDGKHGASFTTYAYYRVRGAIFDGLRRMGWLPRGEYARTRFDERAGIYLNNLADRDAGAAYYGDGGSPSVEDEVRDLARALGGVAAIFVASLSTQDEEAMLDHSVQPQESLERREAQHTVREVVSSLPDKERRLIQMYYFEEKTFEEIGAALGLSKSWTSRLHTRAIDLLQAGLSLREPLGDGNPAVPARRRRATSRR
jgi:RNA polymerase sigma factor for flagellar operon FliA